MSLINQMLKDLESRNAGREGDSGNILKGLAGADMSMHGQRKIIALSLTVLVAGLMAFFIWKEGYYKQVASLFPPAVTSAGITPSAPVIRNDAVIATPAPIVIESVAEPAITTVEVPEEKMTGLYDSTINPVLDESIFASNDEPLTEKPKTTVVDDPVIQQAPSNPVEIIRKDKPLTPVQMSEVAYTNALDKLKEGYFSDSLKYLYESLKHNNGNIPSRDLLANLLVRTQRLDEALAVLSEGMELYPYQIEFVHLYARILAEKGLNEPALQALERISPDAARNPDYYALRATLNQQLGRHALAVRIYQDILRVKPEKGRWWMGLAISLHSTGQYQNAIKAYQNALASGNLDYRMQTFVQQKIREIEQR